MTWLLSLNKFNWTRNPIQDAEIRPHDCAQHTKPNLIRPIFLLFIFILIYLNFINSFIYRYDVGENLDDKMVSQSAVSLCCTSLMAELALA